MAKSTKRIKRKVAAKTRKSLKGGVLGARYLRDKVIGHTGLGRIVREGLGFLSSENSEILSEFISDITSGKYKDDQKGFYGAVYDFYSNNTATINDIRRIIAYRTTPADWFDYLLQYAIVVPGIRYNEENKLALEKDYINNKFDLNSIPGYNQENPKDGTIKLIDAVYDKYLISEDLEEDIKNIELYRKNNLKNYIALNAGDDTIKQHIINVLQMIVDLIESENYKTTVAAITQNYYERLHEKKESAIKEFKNIGQGKMTSALGGLLLDQLVSTIGSSAINVKDSIKSNVMETIKKDPRNNLFEGGRFRNIKSQKRNQKPYGKNKSLRKHKRTYKRSKN